jgi:exonuclease I
MQNIYVFQNTNHQQMHKESFIINRNTLLHVSTLLGHLQGETFVIVTLELHFTVE